MTNPGARLFALAMSVCAMSLGGCAPRPRGEVFRPEAASPEQAVLYVFREARSFGQAPVRIVVNQEPSGELRPGEYLAFVMAPGEHLVRVELNSEDTRQVRLLPGDSAYLRVVTTRLHPRRPTLDQPETALARRLIAPAARADP